MTISAVLPEREQQRLADRYKAVREQTVGLCAPLQIEDYVVSTMPDVSPTKWHLAHTSWFFETFVLAEHAPDYVSPNPKYAFLRSEEHTSELQSQSNLVCRLLLEKKNPNPNST